MKFERMKLPVLTGISAIEKYSPKEEVRLSSCRIGIPCLVMNGKVCNLNGVPFQNEFFQEDFNAFSERVANCKTIVFGRVIDKTNSYSKDNIYDLYNVNKITYNTNTYLRIRSYIQIEAENLFSTAVPAMESKSRLLFLENMIKSIANTEGTSNVIVQNYVSMDKYDKKIASKFILNAAERNETVLFLSSKSTYIQGNATLNEARSFYLNPFETFNGVVQDFTKEEKKSYDLAGEMISVVKDVTLNCAGEIVVLNMDKEKDSRRRYVCTLLENKRINKFKFEAVELNGLLQFQRPL